MEILSFIFLTGLVTSLAGKFETRYRWKYIDYVWESPAQKVEAIQNGLYNETFGAPMDIQPVADGRVFVTVFGQDFQSPGKLSIVTDQEGPGGPLLQPYPDWSWFEKDNCDGMQETYRIAVDECEKLWVLDNGNEKCQAQILTFDLRTNELVNRVKIPRDIAGDKDGISLLVNIVVETEGLRCEKQTVYMADSYGHGLIVYDNDKFKRFESQLFQPSEAGKNVEIGPLKATWTDGVVGISLTPRTYPGADRYLAFRPLPSYDLYFVNTRELKRKNNGDDLDVLGARDILQSQIVGTVFAADYTLFFGFVTDAAIACYNVHQPLKKENIVILDQNEETMQWVNQLKIIPRSPGNPDERLWVLTNRFPLFYQRMLNFEEYNFYVLAAKVSDLTAGTRCQNRPQLYQPYL